MSARVPPPVQAPHLSGRKEITNYELGLKTDLFDRKLRFNADVFYLDFKAGCS